MLTATQIVRLIETGDSISVVDRILANGRCRSPLAKRTLRQPKVAPVAALGLGLQRISELSYRPTPMADRIAECLAAMQCDDGMFRAGCETVQSSAGGGRRRAATLEPIAASDADVVVAATAVALRGLIAWRQLGEPNRLSNVALSPDAVERGLDAIAAAFERDLENNALHRHARAWAIVLWQLGDVDRFRARVAVDDLLDVIEAGDAETVSDDISRYAQAVAA